MRFTAKIEKIGINPVVDPPEEVLAAIFAGAGRAKGPVPVHGSIGGARFRQTLVRSRGSWRLYINGEMLKTSGLKVGDLAEIEIEFDPMPRIVPVPEALASALERDAEAKELFEGLVPSRQKEILRYLGSLKTAGSVDRNIKRLFRRLREKR